MVKMQAQQVVGVPGPKVVVLQSIETKQYDIGGIRFLHGNVTPVAIVVGQPDDNCVIDMHGNRMTMADFESTHAQHPYQAD